MIARIGAFLVAIAFLVGGGFSATAQDKSARDLFPNLGEGFGGQSGPGGSGFGGFAMEDPVTWKAAAVDTPNGPELQITAEPVGTWYVYSVTQKAGGPLPTKFEITKPKGLKPVGAYVPSKKPKKALEPAFGNLEVEKHVTKTIWTARLPKDVSRESSLKVRVRGQACQEGGGCIPINTTLTARWSSAGGGNPKPAAEPEKTVKPFRDTEYVVDWTARLRPASVAPGGNAVLEITAKPDKDYHVYRAATDDADTSTNFLVVEKSGLKIGAPQTDAKVITKSISDLVPPFVYHPGAVTWRIPIQVPEGTAEGAKKIVGQIAYLACTETSCLPPRGLQFETTLTVGGSSDRGVTSKVVFAAIKNTKVLDAAADADWVDAMDEAAVIRSVVEASDQEDDQDSSVPVVAEGGSGGGTPDQVDSQANTDRGGSEADSLTLVEGSSTDKLGLAAMILFGFLGGMILNVMPCVLPVIGLKVMSFISQAGEDRKRILALNLAYVSGIFGVFIVLASAGAFLEMAWGEQFQNFGLRMTATIGLFAFALSYLGVWEIPAPGMVSSKAGQSIQKQEGLLGAMGKGVFATILATPCSAPLLGGVFSSLAGAEPITFYIVFLSIAAGMAFPYIVIGFVPAAAAWLPKPGTWMEKFKEFMAFIMLFSTAYFFYQFSDENKLKVFITLIGVWLGCWIIGQVPAWESIRKRLTAGVGGIVTATLVGIGAFNFIGGPQDLEWQDYSEPVLVKYQQEGKTVLVDFSAKWCPTCLYNVAKVIDTPEVAKVVDELDVVPMYADWTNYDEDITKKLTELRSRSIPILAIYPAGKPNQPIILRDVVTKKQVINALRKAGPSREGFVAVRSSNAVPTASLADSK